MDPSGVDIVIAHHGIKGQKWGIRRKLDRGGSGSSSAKSSDKEDKEYEAQASRIQHHLKKQNVKSELVQAKYGPDQGFKLTPGQKKALIYGGVLAALVAASVISERTGTGRSAAATQKAFLEARDGLELNWNEGVHLPKGSILKRISTVAETEIRPGGFYAAHRPEDVESYKAILPTFWRQWGVGTPKAGGFVNSYTAQAAVKAPSGKETYELFSNLLRTNDKFASEYVGILRGNDISESLAKAAFTTHVENWVDPKSPANPIFFKAVKAKGYNALIDFNDAGRLGKQPLRVLDSKIFKITENAPLTYSDIKEAAVKWTPEMIHSIPFAKGDLMSIEFVNDFLEHHGIKGQKWGVRRKHPSGVSVSTKPGKRIKVSGGHNLPPHEDAVVARTAGQKAKKSTTDSLSNRELQALVTRLNLEQQLSNLSKQRKNAGAKFAGDVLANIAKQQVTKIAGDAVSKQVAGALGKK